LAERHAFQARGQISGQGGAFYFRPGNLGYPVFETAFAKVGVYICYDRPSGRFPFVRSSGSLVR
jgi:predicted amidohydrolase